MDLQNAYAVTIAFNERESETVHMITQDGHEPTESEIRSLVAPYVRQVYHESGEFEIEDITNVQKSVDKLLSFSHSNPHATSPAEQSSGELRSKLMERIQAAEAEAARGSGSSDVLFESRVQAAYSSILESVPDADKDRAEAILKERGYDPDPTPYEPDEGECDLTGIEIDCCPCGRHP